MEPDEKACPSCTRVLKAAAVKCPHCRADLPVEVAAAEESQDAPAGTGADVVVPDRVGPADPAVSARPVLRDPVLIGLVVLSLLLASGLVWIVLTSRSGDLAVAENGQVTSTSYRNSAMSAAAANVTTVLSYSYATLDEDAEAARKVLTPEYFAQDYRATIAERAAEITSSKLTQVATVLSTSIVSLTEGEAALLLLTNITNVPEGSQTAPPQVLSRLDVTMERKDGAWIVSQVTGF